MAKEVYYQTPMLVYDNVVLVGTRVFMGKETTMEADITALPKEARSAVLGLAPSDGDWRRLSPSVPVWVTKDKLLVDLRERYGVNKNVVVERMRCWLYTPEGRFSARELWAEIFKPS